MIAHVRGHLVVKTPQYAVIDVNGVGYKVFIPLTTFTRLPHDNAEIILHTYTHVREDAILLYGFSSAEERDFFTTLLTISGVGPKMGLNLLSGSSLSDLMKIVESEDTKRLSMIPGVGKKTAARIILELKEKLPVLGDSEGGTGMGHTIAADALSALINLGYPRAQAYEAVRKVREQDRDIPVESLIREALKILSR